MKRKRKEKRAKRYSYEQFSSSIEEAMPLTVQSRSYTGDSKSAIFRRLITKVTIVTTETHNVGILPTD